MKLMRLTLLTATLLVGCDSNEPATAATHDCTRITSALERLACFDAAAGTPPGDPSLPSPATEPVVKVPAIRLLVEANEAGRQPEETGSRITRSADALPGQDKVMITVPALAGTAPDTYLAISCLSNISRLQLLSSEPLPVNHIDIRLLLDGRPVTPRRTWQVLEDGTVSDAGRGLVAIEQLRQLTRPGERLQIESDHAAFDGMAFDARALARHMSRQREACHW
ncbi:MAG: type VI secretion system-associated protein TagO [Paucimonas sp.]|jgi:type VI secretion system protein VasI|nr:type VI secretion system-associated protein TagO [Paucimonas sp.]